MAASGPQPFEHGSATSAVSLRGWRYNTNSTMQNLTDFLQVRLPEPCSRGALNGVHQGFTLLKEISGVESMNRLTNSQLYSVIYKEMLSSATQGGTPQTSPTDAHHHDRSPGKWWSQKSTLLPTSEFSRGGSYYKTGAPYASATTEASSHLLHYFAKAVSQRVSQSKTTGADREIQSKPMVVDAACFLLVPDWLTQGWSLLTLIADFQRDYFQLHRTISKVVSDESSVTTQHLQSSENYWHR